jgi:hypothetical protein
MAGRPSDDKVNDKYRVLFDLWISKSSMRRGERGLCRVKERSSGFGPVGNQNWLKSSATPILEEVSLETGDVETRLGKNEGRCEP